MGQIEAILFDYGGTLTRLTISPEDLVTKCLRNIQTFLQSRGIAVSMARLKEADKEAWRLSQVRGSLIEANATEFMTELLREAGVDLADGDAVINGVAEVDYMTAVPYIELLPETLSTLQVLSEHKLRMGVVSNNVFPQMLRTSIERLGLGSFFCTVVASGDVGVRKPASEVFRKALGELGCRVEETLFVGDRLEEDVAGAQNVGMVTVWVNSSTEAKRGSIVPDYEVRDLSAILQILGLSL